MARQDVEADCVELPIGESFDLHAFAARERLEMLDGYLEAAQGRGFRDVRVIHGRGSGVARAEVRAFLHDDPRVGRLSEAPPELGGWGATMVRLNRPVSDDSLQPVFVGDIQGCFAEFDELLRRVHAAFGDDYRLFVAGDAVNRGYDNLRVLELIRARVDAGLAQMVLGNHELHLLRVALGLIEPDETHTFHDVLESDEREDWVRWLLARPIATHGQVGGSTWVMVHASVHPDWSWEQAIREARRVERHLSSGRSEVVEALLDPSEEPSRRGSRRDVLGRITCARTVRGPRCRWSSRQPALPEDEPWHVAWRRRRHDYGVVYGHWATQGLNVAPGLRGLDSGCVHHGRRKVGYLSAWIPQRAGGSADGAFRTPDPDIWQVRARFQRQRVAVSSVTAYP
jgi:bis(5'-nucleosyl)-tetraphosphatase (symmetrical)